MQEFPIGKRDHSEEKRRDKKLMTDKWSQRDIRCGTNRKCRIWKRFSQCATDTAYKLLRVSLCIDNSARFSLSKARMQLNLDIFTIQMDWIRAVAKNKNDFVCFICGKVHLVLWFIVEHTCIIPLLPCFFQTCTIAITQYSLNYFEAPW